MASKLIPVKTFLGGIFTQMEKGIKSSSKYNEVGLEDFFIKRFHIQDNKVQMLIDHTLEGLSIVVNGNEIQVSPELYNHPYVNVSNSIEQPTQADPAKLFDKNIFSTVSYMVCQNHTMFHIIQPLSSPIYIKYKTDYEAFYNSVLLMIIDTDIDVEVVEEFESKCALNSVTNYIVHENSTLNVSTFYNNIFSAESYSFKNILALENAHFTHNLFGHSSANVLDEMKITCADGAKINLNGMIRNTHGSFHSIINVNANDGFSETNINYKNIVENKSKITVKPIVEMNVPSNVTINITNLSLDETPQVELVPILNINHEQAVCNQNIVKTNAIEIAEVDYKKDFFDELLTNSVITSTFNTERFYESKERFILSI